MKPLALQEDLVRTSHNYYQGLIAFRKAHPALRLTQKSDIIAALTDEMTDNNNLVVMVNNGAGLEGSIVSVFNADAEAQTVTLPEGKWNVCVTKSTAGTEALAVVEGSVTVEGTSAMILTAAAADAELKPLAEETADELTEEEAGSMLDSIKAFFDSLFG